jgi:hypothetical protein
MSQQELRVDVEGGKYTVIQDHNGELKALRYGQPWRNLSGDKLVLCLAQELDQRRTDAKELSENIKLAVDTWSPVFKGSTIHEMFSEAKNQRDSVSNMLTQALQEIESQYIDWARFNSGSPDYDEDYKPHFPPIVTQIRETLKAV